MQELMRVSPLHAAETAWNGSDDDSSLALALACENVQIPSCVGHGADHRAIDAEYGKEASDDVGLRMRGLAAAHSG